MDVNQLVNEIENTMSNDDLKDLIESLLRILNRGTGQALVTADYSKIAHEIQAIDKWSGDAFQKDDEVDNALQAIAEEIDFPRNGSQKKIQMKDIAMEKHKYTLYAYNDGSYSDAEEAVRLGGNWELITIEMDSPLTLATLDEENRENPVTNAIVIANNAFNVFGHLEDSRIFITDVDDNVLFVEADNGLFIERKRVQQATFHLNAFITIEGENLEKRKKEILAFLQANINGIIHDWCPEEMNIVETEVIASEDTRAMTITNI